TELSFSDQLRSCASGRSEQVAAVPAGMWIAHRLRMRLSLSTFAVVAAIALPVSGQAATIRVPSDVASIQQAIDAAAGGDTVVVSPGTYVENVDFHGKAVTVASEQGPAATIIDGGGAGSVVTFASGETRSAVLRGFTIRHGLTSFSGGGVLVQFSS